VEILRLLASALFWRILLSSLVVVGVLGWGLYRATAAHEELENQFERLVRHDLKLADDAEVLLRLMADLETGKRGYLLTGDRSFLTPYEQARRDLEGVLLEAQTTAENGMEDERVASFSRLVHDWLSNVVEPQIHAREKGAIDAELAGRGKSETDAMRVICTELRSEAMHAAESRNQAAFRSAVRSRSETTAILLASIFIALGSGIWIARDLAGAAAQLEAALAATGKLQPLPPLPDRKDELGSVGRSLATMAGVLYEKDASLRATLSEREETLRRLTEANAALAARDLDAQRYAVFVRQLKTLDIAVLSDSGLRELVRLAEAHVGVLYLLDAENQLIPVHASTIDATIVSQGIFSADGLPRSVMEAREPLLLSGDALGASPPTLDLGVGKGILRWVLAQPIAVGEHGAGTVVLSGLHPLKDERVELITDATRQYAVALHNAWTHDRLREKSVMLAEQGDTLTRANRVKTEFLTSMSHELRTPLSAIIGFADLLISSPREDLSTRARESLERIKRNGDHLLSLINDVLDLAKAEAGKVDIRLTRVNLPQLVRACVAEVDSLRGDKDLRLAADVGDAILETMTDTQRVRQILLNLLSNAIKFTERGEVVVTVHFGADDIQVAVRDTGLGIPASALPELFRDFKQLDAGDGRRYPGTGIGLALSRRLARALGGEIDVRSREGEGSTFTLVLPRIAPVVDLDPPSITATSTAS
jgi:signal transduction histidine kinase/CHASE3 domain sensor protein